MVVFMAQSVNFSEVESLSWSEKANQECENQNQNGSDHTQVNSYGKFLRNETLTSRIQI